MKSKEFTLIPVDYVPNRTSVYKDIVMAFVKSDDKECQVKMDYVVKSASVCCGLYKAIKDLNLEKQVKRIVSGEGVYLVKDF
jgi:hypothetical protein